MVELSKAQSSAYNSDLCLHHLCNLGRGEGVGYFHTSQWRSLGYRKILENFQRADEVPAPFTWLFSPVAREHSLLLECDSAGDFALLLSFFHFFIMLVFPLKTHFSISLKSSHHLHLQNMENGGKGRVFLFTSKALPGQLLFHLLVNAINICNCFSRQKCKENIFPTAEDMKGRIQNMKKYLELLHCFRHKLSVSTYITMYGVGLYHWFQAFPLIQFVVQKQIN